MIDRASTPARDTGSRKAGPAKVTDLLEYKRARERARRERERRRTRWVQTARRQAELLRRNGWRPLPDLRASWGWLAALFLVAVLFEIMRWVLTEL